MKQTGVKVNFKIVYIRSTVARISILHLKNNYGMK